MTFRGRQINLDLWKAIKALRELNNRGSLCSIWSSYWRLSFLWALLKFGVFVAVVSWYLVLSRINDLVSAETLIYGKDDFLHLCLSVVLVPGDNLSLRDHFRCDGDFPAGLAHGQG